jgi:DNA-binding transcriptional MocR family regulator
MGTIFELDLASVDIPKYKAVIELLRSKIMSGDLSAGDKLPPVRELAWDLKITPGTVARAYQDATNEGLLEATVGRGTFVAAPKKSISEHPRGIYVEHPSGMINLRNSNTVDVGQGREIADAMIRTAEAEAQNYIFYPGYEGRHRVYPFLVEWMKSALISVDPDTIILTHGGQSSISLALQSILQNTKGGVAIDALAYPGIRYAVEAQGGVLHGIEIDDEGMIPKALEDRCKKGGIKVIFTSANVLNPSTGSMSLERRIEIAEIARKYDLQVIEDDCWGIGTAEVTGFHSICPERAWYITSITKNVSAGLRFGWLVCPVDQLQATRRAMRISCFGVSRAVSDIVYQLMLSGAAFDIRERVQSVVALEVAQAVNLLGKWDISFRKDIPFIWLKLPPGWRASAFAGACERAGISVRPADEFSLKDSAVPNAVRISLNNSVPKDQYIEALTTMSRLLDNPPVVGEG